MATNIFNQNDYKGIVKRIDGINAQSQRKWGRMNALEMLEHCSIQLQLGLGMMPQHKKEGSFIMRTSLGKYLFLFVIPWTKNLPTPSTMNILEKDISMKEIQEAKQNLLDLLEKVQNNPNLKPHPFFGKMNQKYWGRLIWKHLDHHLKQFGV